VDKDRGHHGLVEQEMCPQHMALSFHQLSTGCLERDAQSLHHPLVRKTCGFLTAIPPLPSSWRRTLVMGPSWRRMLVMGPKGRRMLAVGPNRRRTFVMVPMGGHLVMVLVEGGC